MIKRFIKKSPFCLFAIGSPSSGKSNLSRYICKSLLADKSIDYVIVFSPTYFSGDGNYDFLDEDFIYPMFKEDILRAIMTLQKKRVEKGDKSSLLIVFDDCLGSVNWNSKIMTQLIANRRHYNCSLLITTQHIKKLPPIMRSCVDYCCIFKTSNREVIKVLNSVWMYDTPEDCGQYLSKMCKEKYNFCFIDCFANEETKYHRLKVPLVGKFKVNFSNTIGS